MRVRLEVLLLTFVGLIVPATASADYVHTVGPGESLTSVAAADGLTVAQLAAANGLSPNAQLVAGSGLQIPPQIAGPLAGSTPAVPQPPTSGAGSAPAAAAPPASVVGDGDGDSDDVAVVAAATVSGGDADNDSDDTASGPTGVAPAAPGATSVSTPVYTGSVATSQPIGAAAEGSPINPPYPTPQTVSPYQVGAIASANGVPPSLAQAIAYQESGFNNAAVSVSDARGVMQILPGTWSWIQQTLVPGVSPLAPASASDNVRGGVLLLHSLLNATGGNAALAAAGYYQGLPSVEANGMYPSTQQYVNNVLALQQQFAGGG